MRTTYSNLTIRKQVTGFLISLLQIAALVFCNIVLTPAQEVTSIEQHDGSKTILGLSNDQVEYSIIIDSGKIISDKLAPQSTWAKRYGAHPSPIETDADVGMEIMWTDWQAPKTVNNAENPVKLTKNDFQIDRHEFKDLDGGRKQLTLYFKGNDIPLLARFVYQLEPASFYVRRKLVLIDTSDAGHFLQKFLPFDGTTRGPGSVIKEGGFGQPVAFRTGENGGFFGLEYPAADNAIQALAAGTHITCGQEIGAKIGKAGVESEWVVEGISPNSFVKWWFMKYVNDIRVVPLKPFTLYNSWYDLRSTEYPRVAEGNWMNEKNIFHIIDLIRKNMIDKHSIKLDAFVLDDGWDVYESDWVLRQKEFPRGLKPISDELARTGTSLGLWFGPTGGYSFRMKRVNWMKDHGYEVVGNTPNTAMMCLAGKNYGELFKKRTTNFVENEGVGYFKWDGLQFSCSEPAHGHPVGIYSRRAVMESLIDKVHAVRKKNPNIFLNITSGTWLSPWWVKYANTIWMQGADYGYADVPSISPRDAAITYRDFVLYDDFKNQNMWFPIANLMTHGIIKGNLQWLGGKEEPLDKFTNEVLLYFARGVAMWELYISPDILTDGEWDAIGQAMHWAKDRFPILSTTEMVGGDPTKRETYGYVHFNGTKGIIAARNPWIESASLRVKLDPSNGLEPDASSLVFERVYPTRWISPTLYQANSTVEIPLEGYETAVYEVYPVSEAKMPLLAGAVFDVTQHDNRNLALSLYEANSETRLLNPQSVEKFSSDGKNVGLESILRNVQQQPQAVDKQSVRFASDRSGLTIGLTTSDSVTETSLAILLTPAKDAAAKKLPQLKITIDGREDTARFQPGEGDGASTWYTMKIPLGKIDAQVRVLPREQGKTWKGHVNVWAACRVKERSSTALLTTSARMAERPMPPRPFPVGTVVKNIKIGEAEVESSDGK